MQNNSLGSVQSINLYTDKPIKFQFNDLEFKSLQILVGMNGTGKSFIMTTVYAMTSITNAIVAGCKKEEIIEAAQFVSDHCFRAPITGVIKVRFPTGQTDVAWKEGKVLNVECTIPDTITERTNVIYMSSSMRKFQALAEYLRVRKSLNLLNMSDIEQIVKEMCNHYMLYDVSFIENLIRFLPYKIDEQFKERLEGFNIKDDIVEITIDMDQCDFFTVSSTGEQRSLSRWYGSGHQALINMMLGSILSSPKT